MKQLSFLLTLLLLLASVAPACAGGQKTDNLEHLKRGVAKLGVGSKARATITLNNGTKVKGYVYSAGDEDFVMRDRKTDAATTVRYADVKGVDDNRGHRNAMLAVIFVGIGAAGVILAAFGGRLRHKG